MVISSNSKAFEGNYPDFIFIKDLKNLDESKKYITNNNDWSKKQLKNVFPYYSSLKDFRKSKNTSGVLNFIEVDIKTITNTIIQTISSNIVLVFNIDECSRHDFLNAFTFLEEKEIKVPIILKGNYDSSDFEQIAIDASIDLGSIFLEGMGNGIWIQSEKFDDKINELSFLILQNTRTRIIKTDYISCPSCGRTKFDLQKTTALVKKYTNHLKGLKISVMGCIVNGPGEMADADYGYVGSGDGVISLYKGKELVKRNISSKNAVNELIHLIKDNDDWIDPKN